MDSVSRAISSLASPSRFRRLQPLYSGKQYRLGYNWFDKKAEHICQIRLALIGGVSAAQLRLAATIARINEFVDIFIW